MKSQVSFRTTFLINTSFKNNCLLHNKWLVLNLTLLIPIIPTNKKSQQQTINTILLVILIFYVN